MAGKHEPPTRRSFYVSLATSTLRAGILVAAVVLGVIGLSKAFPDNVQNLAPPVGQPSPIVTTPATGGRTPTPPVTPRKGKIKGIVVLVLNGTSTTGLAASTTDTLQEAGYTVKTPDNAESIPTTTIFYRRANKVDADLMKTRFFPTAVLKVADQSVPEDVMLQVVLGEDYAVTAGATP